MKRSFALLISMLFGAVFLVSTGPAAAAAPYCGITWGSLPESHLVGSENASIAKVRSGQHPCFDRLVIDVHGDVAGYDVRYVSPLYEDPTGAIIPLRGAADLQVLATAPNGGPGIPAPYVPGDKRELADVTGYSTFRQVAFAGSFEGQTRFGLGVRARLPFRAFVLDGPDTGSRLVVDVAHHW
jgi:hypothetical protein